MTNFMVIDSLMGSGKTTAVLENLFADRVGERIFKDRNLIVVTPYLSELSRFTNPVKQSPFVHRFFVTPEAKSEDGKLGNLKEQLKNGMCVVITHALFQMFDNEVKSLIAEKEYSLIVDEVPDVITPYPMKQDDLRDLFMFKRIFTDEKGFVRWNEEFGSYDGIHNNFMNDCKAGRIVYNEDLKTLYRIYPFDTFLSFRKVYIVTYMFEAQLIYYYFQYYGFTYEKYVPVELQMIGDRFQIEIIKESLVNRISPQLIPRKDFSNLIHICENEKMNQIGKNEHSLSSAWYTAHSARSKEILTLKKNMFNFFHNICKAKSGDCMWTVVQRFQSKLTGSGYAKGFLPINARATNEFRDRTAVAYMSNRYINPFVTNFFESAGIKVDQDAYALSEMIQFIFRSAVRDGKEINLYIPSKRMRTLLKKWIEDVKPLPPSHDEIDDLFV